MSVDQFSDTIKEYLQDRKLIIVSNREPYMHKRSGSAIKVDKPAGGLTSAMDQALRATGGTWVAWGSSSEDRAVVDERDCVPVPPGRPAYTLKRVWLTPEEVENYYHGYSNHMLWPLCHIALDRVYFRKKYWEDYKKANLTFANGVLEQADENSLVWIHDYHLCLVPQILREKNPKIVTSHFWHIPWPNYSVLRICPQSTELIKAMLNNDLIGFQIHLFVQNFLECVKESLEDAEINYDNETVTYNGHTTKLKAFPISVDFDKFNTVASSIKTTRAVQKIRKRYDLSQRQIGIGVDRIEYTKGLIKRFQAIDLFFQRHPEYLGKFTFIQIAVPTRMKEPYISYKASVESLVRKINKKYAQKEWNPVVYRDIKSNHTELAAYYRMADVAIISSIYDGMNLVAKEFIASQVNKNGGLLLSEFAGAAEELDGAILVNPYDIEEFSDSIKKVLDMSGEEKMCRINDLRRQVKEKDIYYWIADFLSSLTAINLKNSGKARYLFNHTNELPADNMFLFLDYDGTLAPIAESPDKAVMPSNIHNIIMRIKEKIPVAIVTGRSIDNIINVFGTKNLIYAGNHGAEIWNGKKFIKGQQLARSRQAMKNVITELSDAFSSISGVIIEDKGITASIHFRMVRSDDLCRMLNIFWSVVDSYKRLFKITSGKKVFEIRPHGIRNKGIAVKWIWQNIAPDKIPVYIGDDKTDEDAFRAIRGRGIGISIGRNNEADYYLESQDEIEKLLNTIDNIYEK